MSHTPDRSDRLPHSDPPPPHGDVLEKDPADLAGKAGKLERPGDRSAAGDQPPGPTGDMDQPGMNPEAEGQE